MDFEASKFLFWPEHLEGTGKIFLNAHHGATVVELPTVVGGREDSD